MPRPRSRRGPQSQTVDNAIRVLKMIAEHGRELGVTEIAERLGVYPSVASRLVATLEYHTLLEQNLDTKKYQLGIGAVEIGAAALRSMKLVEMARPSLQRLNQETGETVFLVVRDGREAVYVAKFDSPQRVAIQSDVGNREPLHSSSVGKALLAFMPEEEFELLMEGAVLERLTPNTMTDLNVLRPHLAEVRLNGYAIDNEEGEIGIRCIGAPVLNYRGYPVASVSVSAPTFRTPVERLLTWREPLLRCTMEISEALGHRGSG